LYRGLLGLSEYDAWRYQGKGDSEDAALDCELLDQNLSDAWFRSLGFSYLPMAGKDSHGGMIKPFLIRKCQIGM
jgi:hypothetical protein